MRIATYYENRLGRNDGAPLYVTQALKRMGHDVVHFTSEDTGDLTNWGHFDLHIWVDWGEDGLTGVLPYKPMSMKDKHPSAYWACDTHLGYDYRLQKAREFDYVFCNHKRGALDFRRDGIRNESFLSDLNPPKHHATAAFQEEAGRFLPRDRRSDNTFWLPCAVEPLAYPNTPVSLKTYDLSFVGFVSFRKRAEMLDRMFKEFPNFFYGQRFSRWIYGDQGGEDTADIFRKSKIVFNTAAVDDINMRVFETLATGSFLLTEYVPTLPELFENKKHLVWYKSMDEAVDLARYYLQNEKEREQIARAGMEEVLAKHTYENRVATILKTINP